MTNKRTASEIFCVLLLCIGSLESAAAAKPDSHLLPAGPHFDTLPPYGKRFAQTCENLLFPARSWIIRYFQIIGDPPYDTGLTIYRQPHGHYRLMVRQAKPEIKGIVIDAYAGRADLKRAL